MPQSPDPNRRIFLSSLMAAPLLATGCWRYDRYFTIEWDEEVELHNGRIIIVHVKRTFERIGSMRYSRWKGMRESTEIAFDAGGKIGYYKKKFDGYDVDSIDFSHGNWYIELTGLDRALRKPEHQEIVEQMLPVWIIQGDANERAAKSWSEVPNFPKFNMMRVVPDSEAISQFNKTSISIATKKKYLDKYPSDKPINVGGQQPNPD